MTPEDAAFLKSQGWSDQDIANAIPVGQSQQLGGNQSNTQAAINTLKANAGGILGGGAGGIAGGIGIGALAGSEFPVVGNIIGGIAGGLAGAYGGQKIQSGLQSDATNQQQALLAQQAAEQHPITSTATDIIASALAGGGKPSLKGIRSLLSGTMDDAGKAALFQAALNPAVQTGTSLAEGQGIPSLGNLASSALGGAAFSKTWLPHGNNEPTQEIGNTSAPSETAEQKEIINPAQDQETKLPIQEQETDSSDQINSGTLEHGDEVHAIMPTGEEVHGWVNSVDEAGNPVLWTEDGKKIVLPEANLGKEEQEELQKSIIQPSKEPNGKSC